MGYLDTAKRQVNRRAAGRRDLKAPVIRDGRGYAVNDINDKRTATRCAESDISAKSPEYPALDAGPGDPALLARLLELGELHGYPALSLGCYRIRRRARNVGLFAGAGWWQHQSNYFGDSLLAEAVRKVSEP